MSIGGRSRIWQPVGPPIIYNDPKRKKAAPPPVFDCSTESFNKADGLGWGPDLQWRNLDEYYAPYHTFGTYSGQAGTATGYAQAMVDADLGYSDMLVSLTVKQSFYDYVEIIPGARVTSTETELSYFWAEFFYYGNGLPRTTSFGYTFYDGGTSVWINFTSTEGRTFLEVNPNAPHVKPGDRLGLSVQGSENDPYVQTLINNVVVGEGYYRQMQIDEYTVAPDDIGRWPHGRSASVEIIDGNPYSLTKPAPYTTLIDDFSVCPI